MYEISKSLSSKHLQEPNSKISKKINSSSPMCLDKKKYLQISKMHKSQRQRRHIQDLKRYIFIPLFPRLRFATNTWRKKSDVNTSRFLDLEDAIVGRGVHKNMRLGIKNNKVKNRELQQRKSKSRLFLHKNEIRYRRIKIVNDSKNKYAVR